jgi:hypothetical protein
MPIAPIAQSAAAVAVPCTSPPALDDGAAADETDAGDHALDEARPAFGIDTKESLRPLDEAAGRDGDQREGAHTGAVVLALPVPADHDGQETGGPEVAEMRQGGEVAEARQQV